MISYLLKCADLLCQLNLLLICACVSGMNGAELGQPSNPLIVDVNVNSDRINLSIPNFPSIDVREFLREKYDLKITFVVYLYENFNYNFKNYDNNIFAVLFRLSEELSRLICERKVNPSEYINEILQSLSDIQNVSLLNLSSLYLTEIPETVYGLRNLEVLILDKNDLRDFELIPKYFPNLHKLCINGNKRVTRIDNSVLNLPSLELFSATNCSIIEIPESIINLKNLVHLGLSNNPLKSLPMNILNAEKLKFLFISECEFKDLAISVPEQNNINNVFLDSNSSLKSLKIFLNENSRKIAIFKISNCSSINVEVCLNLNNSFLKNFDCNNKQIQEFDYVLKFDPNELISIYRRYSSSKFKIFDYYFRDGCTEQGKNILVKEFDFENKRNSVIRDELIAKWARIYKKTSMYHESGSLEEFEHSINVLNSLYDLKSNDYTNWRNFIPFEYKENMILILSELFDQLEGKNSEFQVKRILKMFKRPYLEQLVYLNYLFKSRKFYLNKNDYLRDFVKEAIKLMKDYVFVLSLNWEEFKNGNDLRNFIFTLTDYEEIANHRERDVNKLLEHVLTHIANAKCAFNSKFTIEFLSEIIYNVINLIDDPELFDIEISNFILENYELVPKHLDYEMQSNVAVAKKVSVQGVRAIINLILNGYPVISQNNLVFN